MGDLTLRQVMLRIAAVLLIASVHGFALAATASASGDPGPRQDERLTLNPLRHVDPIGGLLTVLFAAGWIRPIAVDFSKLRPGAVGLIVVVAAASCATIGLAVLARLTRSYVLNMLPDTAAATLFVFVETLGQLCVSFALFNLLPVPPLSGEHLLAAAWPRGRDRLRAARPWCVALLCLAIATGLVSRLLAPATAAVTSVLWNS